ncbi:MAG TPA: fatty acid desaturase [Planctomycetota bacterium]|nr:fatty acid desaturase [Planctomycetota bacterium]
MDTLRELALPVPWFVFSLILAGYSLWVPALACSFMFFLTGLRLVHDAYHANLGVGPRALDMLLFVMSILMLGSMHAVRFNHLRHHRLCLGEGDVEASSARMPWYQALAFGPVFPLLLTLTAFRLATPQQRWWVAAELVANVVWAAAILAFGWALLLYHLAAMAIGQCLTAFFAVWTVHQGGETHGRTLRGRLSNLISYNMFLHVEHHLFPGVPTSRLPELARRLDRVAPELSRSTVF